MSNNREAEFWVSYNRTLELATELANAGNINMAATAVYLARLKDDPKGEEN